MPNIIGPFIELYTFHFTFRMLEIKFLGDSHNGKRIQTSSSSALNIMIFSKLSKLSKLESWDEEVSIKMFDVFLIHWKSRDIKGETNILRSFNLNLVRIQFSWLIKSIVHYVFGA